MDLKVVIKRLKDLKPSQEHRDPESRRGSEISNSSVDQGERSQKFSYWNAAESLFSPSAPLLVSRQNSYVFYVYKQNRIQNPFSKESNETEVDKQNEIEAVADQEQIDDVEENPPPKQSSISNKTTTLHHWKSSNSLLMPRGQSIRRRRQSVIVTSKPVDLRLDSPGAFVNAKAYWLAEGDRIKHTYNFSSEDTDARTENHGSRLAADEAAAVQEFLAQFASFTPDSPGQRITIQEEQDDPGFGDGTARGAADSDFSEGGRGSVGFSGRRRLGRLSPESPRTEPPLPPPFPRARVSLLANAPPAASNSRHPACTRAPRVNNAGPPTVVCAAIRARRPDSDPHPGRRRARPLGRLATAALAAAMKTSSPSPSIASNRPGLVQNCPAPIVSEPAKALPNAAPRAASAPGSNSTGLMLLISA